MENNGNSSYKVKKFLSSKNTVVAIAVILAIVILLISYTSRVSSATQMVRIPVAKENIQPRTEITADMFTYIDVANAAVGDNVIRDANALVGNYANVNTMIPKGSLFYRGVVVSKAELPDSAVYDVPNGYTLYYLRVDMISSYTNSILPGSYIDIYVSTIKDNKAMVGKLLTNVKILAVKTSDGKNVFENSDESRVPSVIIFALPEEIHLLMRKIDRINSGLGVQSYTMSVIPVPTKSELSNIDKNLEPNVTSEELKQYILSKSYDVIQNSGDDNFE